MIPDSFHDPKSPFYITPRIWGLYSFLKARANTWFTAKQIQEALPFDYPWYGQDKNFTGIIGKQINSDVRLLRLAAGADVVDKLIVSNRGLGYKCGNQKEFDDFFESQRNEAVGKLSMIYRMQKHANLHGQSKIVFQEEPNGRKQYTVFVD